MVEHDSRTARLLAERMMASFFKGLTDAERRAVITGSGGTDSFSPLFSMLSHTFDVFLESVSMPEDEGRVIFQEAVQKKLRELRDEILRDAPG